MIPNLPNLLSSTNRNSMMIPHLPPAFSWIKSPIESLSLSSFLPGETRVFGSDSSVCHLGEPASGCLDEYMVGGGIRLDSGGSYRFMVNDGGFIWLIDHFGS